MRPPCEVIMLAAQGRPETTARTLEGLAGDCGARKTLHWIGEAPPPFAHTGWDISFWPGKPRGQLTDMWHALGMTARECPGADIVYVEDDVEGCRNALAKVVAWNSPYLTMFINTRRFPSGLRLVDDRGLWPLQCIKIPGKVAARLVAENPHSRVWQGKKPSIHEGDLVVGRMLRAWGLKYYQHQSLFQHRGDKSLVNPKATLDQFRVAHDFPGTDFDALTL